MCGESGCGYLSPTMICLGHRLNPGTTYLTVKIPMDFILTPEECRVLAVLIEKERTTPDYYPMTLNALRTASNQKTNRNPVVSYSDDNVLDALEGLRKKRLMGKSVSSGSRVLKYRHLFNHVYTATLAETIVLCLLMLRGPQTIGEIRGRSGRLFDFESLDEVRHVLEALAGREEPMVVELPRRAGHKEARFMHLLGGMPDLDSVYITQTSTSRTSKAGRIDELQEEVQSLREALTRLRADFEAFRREFE